MPFAQTVPASEELKCALPMLAYAQQPSESYAIVCEGSVLHMDTEIDILTLSRRTRCKGYLL